MGVAPVSGQRSWWHGQVCGAVPLADNVVTQQPGAAILITTSVTGTVTLTLAGDGSTIVVNPPVGDAIYPFQVTKAVAGTATVTAYYNLLTA